jgi:hypothetical protein
MKPIYFIIYGITICLYLAFSGYMNCSTFQPDRQCNSSEPDEDCMDTGHSSYGNGSYGHGSSGHGSSGHGFFGHGWSSWHHK